MTNIKKFVEYHKDMFSSFKFSEKLLKDTFMENIKNYYPLAEITDNMFGISQYKTFNQNTFQYKICCNISLNKEFYDILLKYYPEAFI